MDETFGALFEYFRGQNLNIYDGDITLELLDALVEHDIRFNVVIDARLADARFEKR